jgi:endogenous inhibitor of DNA gyrase (YacG/DUF329 family)
MISVAMVTRECPLCAGKVETHSSRTNPPTLYTCSQCGAGLWLISGFLGYRLVVASVGVRT